MDDAQPTFLDYLYIWLKWRRVIFWMVGITTLLAVAVSVLLPKSYQAVTTVLPPKRDDAVGIPATSSPLTVGLNLLGLGKTEELDTYMAILQSRRVREAVVRKFDLQKEYEKETMDETLKALKADVEIALTKENTLTLSVVNRDSAKAAAIANFFIEELDRINKKLSTEQARSNRVFIGQRLKETQHALREAEEAFKSYQEQHNTLGFTDETISALLAGARLEAEVLALEIQRDVLQRSLGRSHPALAQVANQIEAGKRRLAALPEIGLEMARLFRQVEIHSKLLAYLLPQYEQARIQEARDTPTVQIIDPAVPPQLKYAPKRMFIVLGAMVSSLLAALFVTLALESIEQAQIQNTPHAQRLNRVMQELRALIPGRRGPES